MYCACSAMPGVPPPSTQSSLAGSSTFRLSLHLLCVAFVVSFAGTLRLRFSFRFVLATSFVRGVWVCIIFAFAAPLGWARSGRARPCRASASALALGWASSLLGSCRWAFLALAFGSIALAVALQEVARAVPVEIVHALGDWPFFEPRILLTTSRALSLSFCELSRGSSSIASPSVWSLPSTSRGTAPPGRSLCCFSWSLRILSSTSWVISLHEAFRLSLFSPTRPLPS